MPLRPVTATVAVKAPTDGGVKVTATLQLSPGARLQLVVFSENTPCPPVWTAVMSMLAPEAHSCMESVVVVPGRTDAFTPKGKTPTGSNGTSWAQVKYGTSTVSPPTKSWVVEGPYPTPMRAGEA